MKTKTINQKALQIKKQKIELSKKLKAFTDNEEVLSLSEIKRELKSIGVN